jgi:GDP-mannose pyrophosphatase NudK
MGKVEYPIRILEQKIVFDKGIQLEEAKLGLTSATGEITYSRTRINRRDAAAILLYHTTKEAFILTRQFRYAIVSKTDILVPEIAAGRIENQDTPLQTILRETLEETGYSLKEEQVTFLCSCFASPGYSSEKIHVFFAKVNESDKQTSGGGLEEENEHIELMEWSREEFYAALKRGELEDAKTMLAGFHAWMNNLTA